MPSAQNDERRKWGFFFHHGKKRRVRQHRSEDELYIFNMVWMETLWISFYSREVFHTVYNVPVNELLAHFKSLNLFRSSSCGYRNCICIVYFELYNVDILVISLATSNAHWRFIHYMLTFIYIEFWWAWNKTASSILPQKKTKKNKNSRFLCCNISAFYWRNSRVSSLRVRPQRSPCHISSYQSFAATSQL